MVGNSCLVRTVEAVQKPTWPSIDSGGAAVLSTWQRGFEGLSCGTCGEIGTYDALAVGRSAASAIRPLVPHVPWAHGTCGGADFMHVTWSANNPRQPLCAIR